MKEIEQLKRIVIAVGRFQPVHIGHVKMVEQLKVLSIELNAIPLIIVVHPGNKSPKHPLSSLETYATVEWAFPGVRIYTAQNPFVAIEHMYNQYGAIPVGGVTGSDRADTYKGMIGRAIGKEYGDAYHAKIIEREENSKYDSTDFTISGTVVRHLVTEGNFNEFRKVVPLNDIRSTELFTILRQRICNNVTIKTECNEK